MAKNLEQVEVGSKVWLGVLGKPHSRIRPVVKVTPTQIVLEGGDRYYRSNGICIGHAHGCITAVATAAEIEQWEAEQEQAKREAEARRAKQEQIAAKRQELNDLFDANAYVREGDDAGPWKVSIYLSEEGVRQLAETLKVTPPPSRRTD